ncbi:unnamed protein product [Blepharisma stoltei]|uniref:Uncharacterized protein n=1 Tax=Blepharisma stoltei TaxID=1481888 RepID=A0AAU9IAA1_9CILI|nr:unnamed protein product [Blepharisma stoltei]
MNIDNSTHFALQLRETLNETLNLTISLEEFHSNAFRSKLNGESRRNINKIYREVEHFKEILERQKIIKTQESIKKVPKILQAPVEGNEKIITQSLRKLKGKNVLKDTLRISTSRMNLRKIGKYEPLTERSGVRSMTPSQKNQDSSFDKKFGKTMSSWAIKQKRTLDHIELIENRLDEFKKELGGLTIFCEANPGVPWINDKPLLRKLFENPEERTTLLKKYNETHSADLKARGISTPGLLKQKLLGLQTRIKDEAKAEKNAITKTILKYFTELEKPPNYDIIEDPKQLLNRCIFRFKQAQTEQDQKLINTLSIKSKSPYRSFIKN